MFSEIKIITDFDESSSYEIEIEWVKDYDDVANMLAYLSLNTYKILAYFFRTRILMTSKELNAVKSEIKNLLDLDGFFNPKSFINKPKDLNERDLDNYGIYESFADQKLLVQKKNMKYEGGWVVTTKTDGYRYLLYQSISGVYLISLTNIAKIYNQGPEIGFNTILDGELIPQNNELPIDKQIYEGNIFKFFVFDILHDGKENTMDLPYIQRIFTFRDLTLTNFLEDNYPSIKVMKSKQDNKNFYIASTKDNFYQSIAYAIHDMKTDARFETDGLIFTPTFSPYNEPKIGSKNTSLVRKWKPMDKLSIDFSLMRTDEKDVYSLGVKNKENNIELFTTDEYPQGFKIKTSQYGAGDIVEFKWSLLNEAFQIMRRRYDKILPNYIDTAKNIWRIMRNPITEETLTGKNLSLMRKYHNVIKSLTINQVANKMKFINEKKNYKNKHLKNSQDIVKKFTNKNRSLEVEVPLEYSKIIIKKYLKNNEIVKDVKLLSKYLKPDIKYEVKVTSSLY